jgi:hypothetical protein
MTDRQPIAHTSYMQQYLCIAYCMHAQRQPDVIGLWLGVTGGYVSRGRKAA